MEHTMRIEVLEMIREYITSKECPYCGDAEPMIKLEIWDKVEDDYTICYRCMRCLGVFEEKLMTYEEKEKESESSNLPRM